MKTYQELWALATKNGSVQLDSGIYLATAAALSAEQKGWDDGDESKSTDFSTAPFWLETDGGDGPIAVHDAADLAEQDINKCWLETASA